jgi:16S rRNA (uracil1498-N3)-methyltransferase
MRHRFAIAAGQIREGRATLTGPVARQIARVLRLGPGDEILLFDEEGVEHTARLLRVAPSRVEAAVEGTSRPGRESPLRLTVAPALLRGPRMDLLVEKATELGVTAIAPLHLRRCVATGSGRLTRWRAIAREAAEQSGRTRLPAIEAPVPLATFLATLPAEAIRLALWEGEGGLPFHSLDVAGLRSRPAVLVVGPEGGLSREEVETLREAGFALLTLGPRILRAETAPLAALALLQFLAGDLG